MCAKIRVIIFRSFLDILKNVEWPRFLDHPAADAFMQVVCYKWMSLADLADFVEILQDSTFVLLVQLQCRTDYLCNS